MIVPSAEVFIAPIEPPKRVIPDKIDKKERIYFFILVIVAHFARKSKETIK